MLLEADLEIQVDSVGGPGHVYFLQVGKSGAIKIGHSNDVVSRTIAIQKANVCRLYLIGTMSGGFDLEKEIHGYFRTFRVRGEWFKPAPVLIEYIRNCVDIWTEPHPWQRAVRNWKVVSDLVSKRLRGATAERIQKIADLRRMTFVEAVDAATELLEQAHRKDKIPPRRREPAVV